ncbi:LysR family transcriptional regulator [Paenibacillus selenitireducens]|uniref:LysR family transcriptional regulator n=1 Tax=Paenibacillus selenitireducens TaxID=1324314 RepID=A0A1T2XJR5_9BACL|nr:LysR family transcriptional regulator [Paenibacillus selenitireducens]OPA80131.1 LysR family transcriptional regulator [Paenibacillus selenitireducens]
MDLTYFQTFREVAKQQSFTRAAEQLGYAQSSVTMQIQKLEREYGVPLLERAGRQMRLTPPGEELLKYAVPMLDLFAESKEKIAQQLGGSLTIGTTDSVAAYVLPSYLQQLRQFIPGLTIQMYPEVEEVLLNNVSEGVFDVGVLLDRLPASTLLRCQVIREESLVLIAPPDHPWTGQASIRIEDLEGCEFIVTEESCAYRTLFENLLKENGVSFRIGFELGSLEAIKHCVMNGLGLAYMPRIAVEDEINRGALAALPFEHPELKMYLQYVVHPKKWVSFALQSFIELIHPDLFKIQKSDNAKK